MKDPFFFIEWCNPVFFATKFVICNKAPLSPSFCKCHVHIKFVSSSRIQQSEDNIGKVGRRSGVNIFVLRYELEEKKSRDIYVKV